MTRPSLPQATLDAIDAAARKLAAEAPPLEPWQVAALLPLTRRARRRRSRKSDAA